VIDFVCNLSGLDVSKLDKNLRKALLTQMRIFGRAVTGHGAIGLKRHLTRAGGYEPNSPIWRYGGKGGKRVFYNTGTWKESPTFNVLPMTGDVYVAVQITFPETAHPGGGNQKASSITLSKLASQLVTGFSFTPTPQQKKAFWAKIDKSVFVGELGTGNGTWTSPARDYTKFAKSVPVFNEMLKRMNAALETAKAKSVTKVSS